MFTLISTFLGILSGVAPAVVNVWLQKVQLAHEKELLNMRMEAAARGLEFSMFIEDIRAGYKEGESLRLHDSSLSGNVFIETLRASVRPVITYLFFGLFMAVEASAAYVMLASGFDVPTMLAAIWNNETMSIFGAIMGFWFGSRAIERIMFGGLPQVGVNRTPRSSELFRPNRKSVRKTT